MADDDRRRRPARSTGPDAASERREDARRRIREAAQGLAGDDQRGTTRSRLPASMSPPREAPVNGNGNSHQTEWQAEATRAMPGPPAGPSPVYATPVAPPAYPPPGYAPPGHAPPGYPPPGYAPPGHAPPGYPPPGFGYGYGYPPPPPGYWYPPPPSNPGRGFTIAGFVCGLVALLFFPIILGPLGVIFGFVANSKGDRRGLWVGIGSIVTTVLGMILAVALMEAAEDNRAVLGWL